MRGMRGEELEAGATTSRATTDQSNSRTAAAAP